MFKRSSLWALAVVLPLALRVSPAWAQDEPPADGTDAAGGDAAGGDTAGGDDDDGAAAPVATPTSAAASPDELRDQADWADGERTGVYKKAVWPVELVKRPVTLAATMIEIDTGFNINISKNLAGKPIAIPLFVGYGATDKIGIGIATALCISGKSSGCAKALDTFAFDFRYALAQGNLNAAAHAELLFSNFSSTLVDGRVGVIAHVKSGKVGATADPGVDIALNTRGPGRKQFISVPIEGQLQASKQFALVLDLGVAGPMEHFGDTFQIPIGFGAHVSPNRKMDIALRFYWPNLAGKAHTADVRTLELGFAYRL